MELSQNDSGKSIKIKTGEKLSILLPENPTTGFKWNLEQFDENLVELIRDEYVISGHAQTGGGGIRKFTLNVKGQGASEIIFKKFREWVGASSSIDEFSFSISVEK